MKILPLYLCVAMAFSAVADDLQPLGDEFNDAASMAHWQDLGVVEGWQTPSAQAVDIDTTTDGHFRVQPGSITWFANLRGALFFKSVTGDFVATAKLRILSRHNPEDPVEVPNRSFSLSGILAHGPRAMTQAAPVPYTTSAVWPPADFGSDYVPNTENFIFLSFGTAGNPGTRQFEIKATRNSDSRLYYDTTGIDQNSNEAWLQMVRVGDTVVCLRKHSEAADWIVENRYPNPDHPFPLFGPTLQVGITAYTDWATASPFNAGGPETSYHFNYAPPNGNPDLVSEVDYFRYQRPDAALTEAVLQGMTVGYNPASNSTANPPVLLASSAAASPYLGNNANVPVADLLVVDVSANESAGQAVVTVSRASASLGALACEYSMADGGDDYTESSGSLVWVDGDVADKTIVVPLASDGLAEGDEMFTVTLNQLDGAGNFAGGDLARAVTVTIEDHPLDQWRLDVFGAQANSADGQLEADFDGDGLANLLERVLGSDATVPETGALPTVAETNDRLTLTFTPAPAITDAELIVEVSPDLSASSWMPLATRAAGSTNWVLDEAGTAVDDSGGVVTVTDSVKMTAEGRRFVRLSANVVQ
jgi:hypothetical protein